MERYVDTADVAKLVRNRLRDRWPAVKFSVRTGRYAGGSSIRASWTDGPTEEAVRSTVAEYVGGDFDGMTDSMGYVDQLYGNPDGSVELVHYGADFIPTTREISPAWRRKLEAELAEFAGEPYDDSTRYPVASWWDRDRGGIGLARDTHRGEYGGTLVYQLAASRDMSGACEHLQGTYPVGNGYHRCRGCGLRCSSPKAER